MEAAMKMVNVVDFLKIGVMAFVFIHIVNKGLDSMGLAQYKA